MTARLPQLAAMKDECESQSSLLARCNSVVMMADTVMPGLERRLKAQLLGDVHFDAFTRGRYATDASHYQIMPVGVVAPRSIADAERALAICRAEGVAVTARGGGTSQAGQTVNHSFILDCSQYLNGIVEIDSA